MTQIDEKAYKHARSPGTISLEELEVFEKYLNDWRRGLPPYEESCKTSYTSKELGQAIDFAITELTNQSARGE